jgi:hypothetical protein
MGPRPKYHADDRQDYLRLCEEYLKAEANVKKDPTAFVDLSVQLHAAKGKVPVKWRTMAFVRRHGVPG